MTDFGAILTLLPELALAGVAVLALVLGLTPPHVRARGVYAVLWAQAGVLLLTFCHSFFIKSFAPEAAFGGLLDPSLGAVAAGLFLQLVGLVVAWMSKRHSQKKTPLPLEFYGLLNATTVVLLLLVKSSHLLMTFVCLESASLFIALLLGFSSAKAAPKYLFQAGLSAALFLWGMVFIYAEVGSLDYREISLSLYDTRSMWALMGVGLVLGGFIFKLGLFPFTYWLPEVYEGASWPILGYLASSAKFAVAVALVALLLEPFSGLWRAYLPTLRAVVIASALWGGLSAMHQTNLKRLFSLSGVVHGAFILSAILFSTQVQNAFQPIFFYFLNYVAALLLVAYCMLELDPREETLEGIRNSYGHHPGYSMLLVLAVASMAGLPPLGGFVAKFFVFYRGAEASSWGVLAALVLGSVLGLYYYLRLLFSLIGRNSDLPEAVRLPKPARVPLSTMVFTGLLVTVLLGLGLIQGPMSFLFK